MAQKLIKKGSCVRKGVKGRGHGHFSIWSSSDGNDQKKIKNLILQAIMYPVILRTRTIQRAD